MTPLVQSEAERYAEQSTTPEPPYLKALASETRAALERPQMLTGAVEGRLLEMLAFAMGARRVLEIGTYSGYSALSIARALPSDGELITCEVSEEHARFARGHIERSPDAGKVRVVVGPALETIRALGGEFDLVFIDADKTGYPDYVEATLPLLSPRGLIVLDNTLLDGRVLDESASDGGARTMRALNERLAADERLVSVLLTVRDGVTLVRRR